MGASLGLKIFLRSLLVQASWNFSSMQNLGFFFMTWPGLVRRQLTATELRRAGRWNLRTFNTHPYFAGLVAATVIGEGERGGSDEALEGLKRTLGSALGAVGDEFFWATLRPFAALVALPAALAGFAWAPVILLTIYNIPHLTVRAWGVSAGLARGRGIVEMLKTRPLSRVIPALGSATTALVGFLVGSGAIDRDWWLLPDRGLASAAAAGAVFLLLLAVQARGLGQDRLLAGMGALAAAAGVAGVAGAP